MGPHSLPQNDINLLRPLQRAGYFRRRGCSQFSEGEIRKCVYKLSFKPRKTAFLNRPTVLRIEVFFPLGGGVEPGPLLLRPLVAG
jgi:hypothetical protein